MLFGEYLGYVEAPAGGVSTLSFTDLLGNSQEEFAILYEIIHGIPGTLTDFQIRLNGQTTNDACREWRSLTAATYDKNLFNKSSNAHLSGGIEVFASINPWGSSAAHNRSYEHLGGYGDATLARVSTFTGHWGERATELARIDFVACQTGTDTPVVGFGEGTIFELWGRSV